MGWRGWRVQCIAQGFTEQETDGLGNYGQGRHLLHMLLGLVYQFVRPEQVLEVIERLIDLRPVVANAQAAWECYNLYSCLWYTIQKSERLMLPGRAQQIPHLG